MKRSRAARLERLERADAFGADPAEVTPIDEAPEIVIYDSKIGPPPRKPGDARVRLLMPDNGRGPGGSPAQSNTDRPSRKHVGDDN